VLLGCEAVQLLIGPHRPELPTTSLLESPPVTCPASEALDRPRLACPPTLAGSADPCRVRYPIEISRQFGICWTILP
jgi:hypothetical protein